MQNDHEVYDSITKLFQMITANFESFKFKTRVRTPDGNRNNF